LPTIEKIQLEIISNNQTFCYEKNHYKLDHTFIYNKYFK